MYVCMYVCLFVCMYVMFSVRKEVRGGRNEIFIGVYMRSRVE